MLYGTAKINLAKSRGITLPPNEYCEVNPILEALHASSYGFTLTGSRAIGHPREDSDWDFVAHVHGLSDYDRFSQVTKFLDSLNDTVVKGATIKLTRMSSYGGTIEGRTDHSLDYLYRLEIPGYNSVDIQFVRDFRIRLMQIEFFRKNYISWSDFKETKTAYAVWNLAETIVRGTGAAKRYLRWKHFKSSCHSFFKMNGFAITYRNFSEGRKNILAGKLSGDPLEWNWTKDNKFKQHGFDHRISWRVSYWWLNTFYSKWMVQN